MATVKFASFGSYKVGQGNAVKVEVVTSTNTWSIITSATVGVSASIDGVTVDKDENYFVGIDSTIYKYDKNFALVSDWGISGKAYITDTLLYQWRAPHLAVNIQNELFVVCSLDTAGPAINCWAFNSAGISSWARSTITTLESPFSIAPLVNGNIILGGGYGESVGLREYERSSGSYINNYSTTGAEENIVSTNSVGDIFSGESYSSTGYGPVVASKFTTNNSTANWTVNISAPLSNSVINSAYIFSEGLSTTGTGVLRVINKSTGVVTAFTTTATLPLDVICLTTVPNIFVASNISSFFVFDNTATILAQNTTQSVVTILSYYITGMSYPGANIQSPRVLTYKRILLAFADNEIWAEVTA